MTVRLRDADVGDGPGHAVARIPFDPQDPKSYLLVVFRSAESPAVTEPRLHIYAVYPASHYYDD